MTRSEIIHKVILAIVKKLPYTLSLERSLRLNAHDFNVAYLDLRPAERFVSLPSDFVIRTTDQSAPRSVSVELRVRDVPLPFYATAYLNIHKPLGKQLQHLTKLINSRNTIIGGVTPRNSVTAYILEKFSNAAFTDTAVISYSHYLHVQKKGHHTKFKTIGETLVVDYHNRSTETTQIYYLGDQAFDLDQVISKHIEVINGL